MIRVAQHQHGGSFMRLAWDPGITLFSSSTTDIEERVLLSGVYYWSAWDWFSREQFSEELIEFLQYLISLLTDSI
jgi:hypothetical protein